MTRLFAWLGTAGLYLIPGLVAGLWPTTALAQPRPIGALGAEQSISDVTPLPAGMGGLLVSTLTGGDVEPTVDVYADDVLVASGPTGRRIALPPGRYELRVGQGPDVARPNAVVMISEGTTKVVEPFFAAVRVQVVNPSGEPVAGTYVLEATDRGTQYGPVTTAPSEDGPPPATWLLPPGRYRLALGSDPSASEGVTAFSLHAGEVLRYRLVASRGDLLRAELADEDAVVEPSIGRLRWVVGGSFAFDSRNDQLLHEGRQFLLGSLFNRFEAGIDTGPHLALLSIDVDQSVAWLDSDYGADLPIRNLQSRAQAELLYVARLGRIIGPYGRANITTSYLPQDYFPGEAVLVDTRDEAGNLIQQEAHQPFARINLFKAGSPIVLQQGVGVSITPVDNEIVDIGLRAGPSARQAFYRDGRFVDDAQPGRVFLERVDDRVEFGGEATATAGLRVGRVLDIRSDFDSFYPTKLFTGDIDRFPFRWQSSASLGVNEYVSTTYAFTLARDEVVIDKLQVVHGLSVTLQASIF